MPSLNTDQVVPFQDEALFVEWFCNVRIHTIDGERYANVNDLLATIQLKCKQKEEHTYTTGQIAGEFGMSARALNEILRAQHVQYLRRKRWYINRHYANKGIAKPLSGNDRRWTEKGRELIIKLLTDHGHTPIN